MTAPTCVLSYPTLNPRTSCLINSLILLKFPLPACSILPLPSITKTRSKSLSQAVCTDKKDKLLVFTIRQFLTTLILFSSLLPIITLVITSAPHQVFFLTLCRSGVEWGWSALMDFECLCFANFPAIYM